MDSSSAVEPPREAREDGSRARRLTVIFNPVAGLGRRRRYVEALRHLDELGCRLDVRETGGPGDAGVFASEAAEGGCDRVVVAGGDGTINEAVNGLAGAGVPLAILPLGTANVLAAEIGLDLDPRAIAETIVGGVARPVCLGRVRGSAGGSGLFSLMLGAGFDAHVVAGVNLKLKRLAGKGAYVAESLRQLAAFRFPRYRVVVDGTAYEAASVVVAKAHYYGGRYIVAPDARLDQPRFHVCLFQRGGPLSAVRYALALQLGRLPTLSDYRIVTGTQVRIDGPAGDPVQADGDVIAHLPVEIEIVPDALSLVVPAR